VSAPLLDHLLILISIYPSELCGGGNRLSVYTSQETLTVKVVPTVQTDVLDGWSYKGCYTCEYDLSSSSTFDLRVIYFSDDVNSRTLPNQFIFGSTNSPSVCLEKCSELGFAYAGVEYGTECCALLSFTICLFAWC
jgi:hypothetical protein